MRLFRQDRRGDWQGVFRRIEAAIAEHMASQAVCSNGRSPTLPPAEDRGEGKLR